MTTPAPAVMPGAIRYAGRTIPVGTTEQILLERILSAPVPLVTLARELWPADPPVVTVARLRVTAHRVSRKLAAVGCPARVSTAGRLVRLVPGRRPPPRG